MKKVFLLTIVTITAMIMNACNESKKNAPVQPGQNDDPVIVDPQGPVEMRAPKAMSFATAEEQLKYRTNEFSFNLLSLVSAQELEPNLILSPLSASMMLGMVMNGATGETLKQLQKALGFKGLTEEEINAYYKTLIEELPKLDNSTLVKIANSIWVDGAFPILPEFVQANQEVFNATAQNVEMADPVTANIINQWADDNTNHLITEIVKPEMIQNAIMILANALYFKGKWETEFQKNNTYQRDFTLRSGEKKKVDMMHLSEEGFEYADVENGQLLELNYKGGQYCMDILLPKQGLDIKDMLAQLTLDEWEEALGRLQYMTVNVALPKVKLRYNRDLTEDLKAAGIKRAFEANAQFSKVSPLPTFLGWVKQFCYMAVDEEGTEAAAVTVGEYECTAIPVDRVFVADRPYLMVIREKKYGSILFVAEVDEPSNS